MKSHYKKRLLIVSLLFFTPTFMHAAAQKLQTKPNQTVVAAIQKKSLDEVLYQALKHTVKDSEHRVKDWAKFSALSHQEKVVQTNCYTSARTVIATLANEKAHDLLVRFDELQKTDSNANDVFDDSKQLYQTEFHGTYFDFIDRGRSKGIAENLFNAAKKKEHLLFYVAPNPWKHAYVIQKVSDGKKTEWRVMESFFKYCSLAEWMGIDPWKLNSATVQLTLLHQRYGGNKVLTHPNEVRHCLKDHFSLVERSGQKNSLYVRMFTVNN